ncbi:MAG: ATPase [Chloroflexi bacterium]|nr:MAG: ATPase [Phototrophicales bacterium]RMF79926.1 MAG: ATPase [Chloroflexota bacterium]
MLTRLRVSGFKNLVDVDVRFGPFTCVAGANGVGKSNLFDAIRFLSLLADHTLVEAAQSIRSEHERSGTIRSIFHHIGDHHADEMSFEVEMIIPSTGIDDLGQEAEAAITFVRYALTIAYRPDGHQRSRGPLEILREELHPINRSKAKNYLFFPHSGEWFDSVIVGRGRQNSAPFISTRIDDDVTIINLHQDGGSGTGKKKSRGRPKPFLASSLPRTVVSASNAVESPTALLARREMQSWRLLQLEPSALRKSDPFNVNPSLGNDGSHLAATLDYLAHRKDHDSEDDSDIREAQVYQEIANNLAALIDDVNTVWVDRDERRELLTLMIREHNGTEHAARSLSDGTLRFLALAVLELDVETQGLLCMEEPENGIYPARIPAMIALLQNIAMDTSEPIDSDNAFRQVIINTHSPSVVQQVPDDSLLVATLRQKIQNRDRFQCVEFAGLSGTWRADAPETNFVVPVGELLTYLNPVIIDKSLTNGYSSAFKRVIDREDLQPYLPGLEPAE